MSIHDDPVVMAVLSLAAAEREKLADYLLSTLHADVSADVDPSEIALRIDAIRRGDAAPFDERMAAVV